jgi:hypothetical protein
MGLNFILESMYFGHGCNKAMIDIFGSTSLSCSKVVPPTNLVQSGCGDSPSIQKTPSSDLPARFGRLRQIYALLQNVPCQGREAGGGGEGGEGSCKRL